MVCERCNEIVGPEDSFCPACGACIKVNRCRRGRGALIAMFVILVGYPLLRSVYLIGAAVLNEEPINTAWLVDTFLVVALAYQFQRAFRGFERARFLIVLFVIAIGVFRILAALVIPLLLDPITGLLGWAVTGIVEIGLGIFILKSRDIEAYIVSRVERDRFGEEITS